MFVNCAICSSDVESKALSPFRLSESEAVTSFFKVF